MPGPPLALAKTTRPAAAGVVPRPRLFRLLDRGRRASIVWVTGPPGCGKTSLVASYVETRRLRALWYQVDEGDADVATVFHYLPRALRGAGVRRSPPLPVLAPEHWTALAPFARDYFRRLFASLRAPFVLVLDDYHAVPDHSPFHDVVRDGLAELPAGGAAIVLSRAEPSATLARLRAGGRLARVGWDGLRLTLAETRAIVRRRGMARAPAGLVRALHDRTEGWAAGVVLSLEHAGEPTAHLAGDEPPESVFEYFAGEILAQADPATQRVLLLTSCLPSLSASMAVALTGLAHADRVLAELARRNYFIARRAHGEPVYQYHALFRLFLTRRARETVPADELALVQRRAAALLAAAGRAEDAVALLREARDWDGLAELVVATAPALVAQGRSLTLEEWAGALPAAVVEDGAWLQYWLGTCRTPFAPARAREHLACAFGRFRAAGDATGVVSAWSGIIGTVIYEYDDFARLDPWLDLVPELVRAYPALPSVELEARFASNVFAGLMFRRPEHPDLPAWAERAFKLSREIRDVNRRMLIGFMLTTYHLWLGDLARARHVGETLEGLTRSPDATALVRITGHLAQAYLGWQVGRPEDTLRAVAAGLAVAKATGVHLWDSELYAQGVYATLAAGDVAGGERFLAKKADVMDPARRLDVSHYHFLSGWLAMLQGDLARARDCEERALPVDSGVPFPMALNHLALAQVLHEAGNRTGAAEHLAQARAIGERMRSRLLAYMIGLVDAHARFAADDETAGRASLGAALALGREHGYGACAWWRPDMMARLAVRALEAGIEVEYVRDLVRRCDLVPAEPPLEVEGWPWPLRVFTLGEFRLVRDGEPVASRGKVQKVPMALLRALIALGGRGVHEAQLAELLWPDADGDLAHQAMATALHRLRQLLGPEGAIVLREGRLSIDPRRCWVDAWAFERLLARADAARERGDADGAVALAERALALYRGPFLGPEADEPWTVSPRERLRRRFLRQIDQLGRHWSARGEWQRAVHGYERGLEVDDLAEEFYRGLMACYQGLGRRAEGLAVYRRCRTALGATLGVEPSAETERLHAALRNPA